MRTRRKGMFAGLALLSLILAACGHAVGTRGIEAAGRPASVETASADLRSSNADGPVQVVWWHTMSGDAGAAVDELAARFNASQGAAEVRPAYQGTDEESLNRLGPAVRSGTGPTMIQTNDMFSRPMIDSGAITPMQQFIDMESYDFSHLEENIRALYTFHFRLYAMPLSASVPMLYYNKDAFAAAGLDPNAPPATYDAFTDAARALTDRAGGMAGGAFPISGRLTEQLLAARGAMLLNHGNGRDDPADEALLGQAAAVDTLSWWKKGVDEGVLLNLGRSSVDTAKAFADGQIAMTTGDSDELRALLQAVDGRFEVGAAPLPAREAASDEDGGTVADGSGLWIMNDRPEAEQQAAWAFVKFLAEPASQAYWYAETGYLPISRTAYDEAQVRDLLAQYPQDRAAIDELRRAQPTPETQGAAMGVFPEARSLTEDAVEEALAGAATPQEALDRASAAIAERLRAYNALLAQ